MFAMGGTPRKHLATNPSVTRQPTTRRPPASAAATPSRFVWETLENRLLLASYAIADYWPMAIGTTWGYSGTVNEDPAWMQMTAVETAPFNGTSATRLHIDPHTVDIDPEDQYFTADANGLQWHHMGRFGDSINVECSYSPALTVLPAVFSDGQAFTDTASFTGLIHPQVGTGTIAGQVRMTTTVVGPRTVDAPAGVFQTVKVTIATERTGTKTIGGTTEPYTYSETRSFWLAKGIGIVRIDETLSDPTGPDFEKYILTESSLLPNFASIRELVLEVSGTAGADSILLAMDGDAVSVTLNGITRSFSVSRMNAIRVQALKGADRVSLAPSVTLPATVTGGRGADTLVGGMNNDALLGGKGQDFLRGRRGNDALTGGAGADLLKGGAGNDIVTSGRGTDVCRGGLGDDIFYCRDSSADLLDGGEGSDQAQADGTVDSTSGIEELMP